MAERERPPEEEKEPGDTSRVIAPKPAPGPITESLSRAKDSRERATAKAQALAATVERSTKLERISKGELEIRVLRPPVAHENGVLEVWIEATRDGKPLPVNNPYLFVNPPVVVPDGTWRRETVEHFRKNEQVEVENFREDPEEAFRQMLVDVVGRAG